jgi:hypothetical protein
MLKLGLGLGLAVALLAPSVAGSPAAASSPRVPAGQARGTFMKAAAFDPTAVLRSDGLHLQVSGPFGGCRPAAGRVTIQATISQRGGAVAHGTWHGACTHAPHWQTTATADAGVRLTPGPAMACALGFVANGGKRTDALQWCNTIRLVR